MSSIGREEDETAPKRRVQLHHHKTGLTGDRSSTSPEGPIGKHIAPYRTCIFPPSSIRSDGPNTAHGECSLDPVESTIRKDNDEVPSGLE